MINITDLLNSNALIEKSTKDFLECYKIQLRSAGVPPESDAEKMILQCLVNAVKVWSKQVKYNKILYGGK